MKKLLINCLLLGLIIVAFTKCKHFLDVTPQGTITQKDVSNPKNVDGLVVAAYAWVPHEGVCCGGGSRKMSPWLADIRSDDAYKGGGGLSDQSPWYQMDLFSLVTSNVGNNDGVWYAAYEGISRCNSALRALDNLDKSVYPKKIERTAEMRFLRGWIYFMLKRRYRWIPYFKEDATPDQIKKISNHPDSVKSDLYLWKDIYQDFKYAADNLPAAQQDKGRPTKYAAEAMMANSLLWMSYPENSKNQVTGIDDNDLKEALTYINDIINSGKYHLNPDFADNFLPKYNDGDNPESIWELIYTHDDGTPNGNLNGGTPLNAPWWPPYFSCCDFHKASYTMVNAFKTDSTTGLPMYNTYNAVSAQNNYSSYFGNNSFDPRISHTVAIPGLPWKYQTNVLFDSSASRNPALYGYFNSLKENVPTDYDGLVNLFWMFNSMNQPVIRYDKILLWKAEILIQLGRDNEALPIINQIRQRAANSTSMLKFANGNSTLNYKIQLYKPGVNCTWTHDFAWKALKWEDRLEFAMEGDRWYDIVRWGIADSVMNNFFSIASQRYSWLKDGHFTAGRDEYLPIPQNQMNWSRGVYKQNPGY